MYLQQRIFLNFLRSCGIFQNLPSGVLIEIKSQFKMVTTVFLREFCEKYRYFWTKAIKQLDWRKKKWKNRQYDRERFQPPTFLGKTTENIISLFCTLFKKRLSFCCFDSYHCQTSLSKEQWFCVKYHHWKKTTKAKKGFEFLSGNVCVVKQKLRIHLPKIGPFRKKELGLVWKKFYPH